jgi:hypothetical protein
MRRLFVLALLFAGACNRHDKECDAVTRIETLPLHDRVKELDAIGVRDPKLEPMTARYRASLVDESKKMDEMMNALRGVLPGASLTDAGALPSVQKVVDDARPLIECLIIASGSDTECAEVSRVMKSCMEAAPGVAVQAKLLSCAGAFEGANLSSPDRVSAARSIASVLRAYAPLTAGVTIDAVEAMARLSRASSLVTSWQHAHGETVERAADIRKACVHK